MPNAAAKMPASNRPRVPLKPPRPDAPPSIVTLAWRQAWRDLRAGELRLLFIAVALAVAALTAVGFFADRLERGLARDARQLLGGDAIVASDQATPSVFETEAKRRLLSVATTTSFPSMARATDAQGGATRLVAIKAVSAAYPLRGRLLLKREPGGRALDAAGAPDLGTVWVDEALLGALQLKLGDSLLLGDSPLKIDKIIAAEPDRGAGFMSFAPRVMMTHTDLAATGLVQPASRVTYRLAVASPVSRDADVREFVRWAEAQIEQQGLRGVRVESMDNGRPEMRQTLERATLFLNLVALLAALLAAVAVAIAAREYAERHLDDCAILRVLGQSQRRIAGAYTFEFAAIGLLSSACGVLLGWAVHYVFVWLLAEFVQVQLPQVGMTTALFGLGVGMTLLMGFGLPPVLQLASVPPLRVIRRDVGVPKATAVGVWVAAVAAFGGLLLAVADDLKLGMIAVGGFALAALLFAAIGYGVVVFLRRTVPNAQSVPRWMALATRQVAARPAFAVLQISALAVGLLAMVLLVVLRTDLIASWRAATPQDAPNRFVINIQPEQVEPFKAALGQAAVRTFDLFPMIRGRLTAINGQVIKPDQYTDARMQRLVEREFNLSHGTELPGHNIVSAGRWTPNEPGGLSVEEGLAESLKLKLGDRMTFDIAGTAVEARITSLRKVDWSSMRVNFFVIYPVAQMPELPTTYISAFKAPADGLVFDNALSRDFPNITNVDVSAQIDQVQRVLGQVIRAVEFLFVFTLACGVVVLFAAVTATREARSKEFAVMRALGASRQLLSAVQRAELAGVGALAGALASIGAMAVGWALARYAFQFQWNPSPWVPLVGTVCGALLAMAAGWWGLREVLRRPVVETLRQATIE
jgi:putative ABC transport system permease protein